MLNKVAVNTSKLTQEYVGNRFKIVEQVYSEPLKFKIQILNQNFKDITQSQERAIKKWLMRNNQYKWFTILTPEYADLFFKVNISNPINLYVNGLKGIEFNITCDASFGYSQIIEEYLDFTQNQSTLLYIDNDEQKYVYPDIKITLHESGDLIIKNDATNKDMIIKGVVQGEVIELNHALPLLESSVHRNLYDSFNFNWFCFVDGYNTISSNLKCTMELNYRETRKVGVS